MGVRLMARDLASPFSDTNSPGLYSVRILCLMLSSANSLSVMGAPLVLSIMRSSLAAQSSPAGTDRVSYVDRVCQVHTARVPVVARERQNAEPRPTAGETDTLTRRPPGPHTAARRPNRHRRRLCGHRSPI